VTSPVAWALYLTRQHYKKTVFSGEDNNIIIVNEKAMAKNLQPNDLKPIHCF